MQIEATESSYDTHLGDANGSKVIKARDALALAKLRQEHAVKRERDAREALAQTETELERARTDHRLEETARQEEKAEAALEKALAGVQRSLDETMQAAELAAKASEERAAATTSLRALEKSMGRAEPEVMAELAAWDATRDDTAPIVAIILAAETLRDRAMAMLNTALDGQREAATLARELGADAHPMPDCYSEALLTLARFDRLPEAEKTDARTFAAVDQVVKTFDPWGLRMHDPTLDAARLYLSHPHWRAKEMLRGA